jgi:hypothetical protein
MRDLVPAMQDCSTLLADHVAASQVPAPLGATGWDVSTLRTLTRRKSQHALQSYVHECRGLSMWPSRHASIADVSVTDLIDETRRIAITSPGAIAFLDASPRYNPMNTGFFTLARHLGVSLCPPQAICAACDAPMDSHGNHALSFRSSGLVSRPQARLPHACSQWQTTRCKLSRRA